VNVSVQAPISAEKVLEEAMTVTLKLQFDLNYNNSINNQISFARSSSQPLCKADVIPIATNAPIVHPPNNEQDIALPAIFLFRRVSSFLGA